jgi:hypothetical protein
MATTGPTCGKEIDRGWRVLGEREMGPRVVVVRQIGSQDAAQTGFVQDDDVIETLATNGTDYSLGIRVLPRGTRSSANLLDAHGSRRLCDGCKRMIAIVHEIARRYILGKGLTELLGCPRRSGMRGDRNMDDAATVMGQDHQDEQ